MNIVTLAVAVQEAVGVPADQGAATERPWRVCMMYVYRYIYIYIYIYRYVYVLLYMYVYMYIIYIY